MSPLKNLTYTPLPAVLRFVGKDVPREAKLLAARGTLPLPPKDLVTALYILGRDPDPEIAVLAEKSLTGMPVGVLKGVLADAATHAWILDFAARKLPHDSELQETIALNKATDDETVLFQATLTNKRLVDIISSNQLRILRAPQLVDVLSENVLTGSSVIDRMLRFVAMETAKTAPVPPPPAKGEGMEVEIEQVEGEAGEGAEEVPAVTETDEIAVVTIAEGEAYESGWAAMTFHEDLVKEKAFASEEELEAESASLYQKVAKMSVAEKVKLAMMGNASARSLLIRDSNKVVTTAVMKSARMTEGEIEGISRSRAVSDEVIRLICGNKDWTKNYQVKLNLVNNSKTPLSESVKYVQHLRDKDLRDLSRSRNVPNQVATAARRLLQKRDEKGKPAKH